MTSSSSKVVFGRMKSCKPVEDTIITRERVVAPPDRFVAVSDGELVSYFQSSFSASDKFLVSQLHEMLDGICSNSFSRLRRSLEQDFAYFSAAAAAAPGTDPRTRDPVLAAAELDAQEARFLANFWQLLEAGHYKLLTAAAWDAALAEEFLLTLPVKVNWNALDAELLPRALWHVRAAERGDAPAELADRILVFHRGVDVAHMKGKYFMQKADLILSFFLIQPIFRLLAYLMSLIGIKKFVPEAPAYMAPSEEAEAGLTDDQARATAKAVSADIRSGTLHAASINVERRTFARTYPDGKTVLKNIMKEADLKEACFKDVIVLYREATPDGAVALGETDLIHDADPIFLKRNIVIKRFASVPIADLELIFPDKKVYMPPNVFVNMAVTLIGGLIAAVTALRAGFSLKVIFTTLSMLGTRAFSVYTAAIAQKTIIERAMQKMLYDRTVASQDAVLSTLTEEMAKQRTRELLLAYCILANSVKPLTAAELDASCEACLSANFGVRVDFTTENALPTLIEWGLVVPAPDSTSTTGNITSWVAIPLQEAMPKLDAVWDALYDFSKNGTSATTAVMNGAKAAGGAVISAPGKILGKVLSSGAPKTAPRPPPVTVSALPATPGAASSTGTGTGGKMKGIFARLGRGSTPCA